MEIYSLWVLDVQVCGRGADRSELPLKATGTRPGHCPPVPLRSTWLPSWGTWLSLSLGEGGTFLGGMGLGFELRSLHLQTDALSFHLHLQSILLWSFWRWGLMNYLPRLASSCDPPSLSLPSSWDYKEELLAPDQGWALSARRPHGLPRWDSPERGPPRQSLDAVRGQGRAGDVWVGGLRGNTVSSRCAELIYFQGRVKSEL
jgi:hypothetical protein